MRNKFAIKRPPLRYKVYTPEFLAQLSSSSDSDSDSGPQPKRQSTTSDVKTVELERSPVTEQVTEFEAQALETDLDEEVQIEFESVVTIEKEEVGNSTLNIDADDEEREDLTPSPEYNVDVTCDGTAVDAEIPKDDAEEGGEEESQNGFSVLIEAPEDSPEITISTDEDEDAGQLEPDAPEKSEKCHYSLRRKRKQPATSTVRIFESDSSDSEEDANKCSKNSLLEVTSLALKELKQLTKGKKRRIGRRKTAWNIEASKFTDPLFARKLKAFFKKRGDRLKQLDFWTVDSSASASSDCLVTSANVLSSVLSYATHLEDLAVHYESKEDVPEIVDALSNIHRYGKLKKLKILRLNCTQPRRGMGSAGVDAIVQSGISFRELELEQFQRDSIDSECIQRLLEKNKDTLHELRLGRIFQGEDGSSPLKIMFPGMKKLTYLGVSTTWDECDEMGANKVDDGFEVKFTGNFPSLRKLSLGKYANVDEIPFSMFENLKTMESETAWNLSVRFPQSPLISQSRVTLLHFPCPIKDPSFVPSVRKFFPHLKEVYIGLPSQSVLHSFFNEFANSKLEILTLDFQFDFHGMLEPCLFPKLFKNEDRPAETQRQLRILKSYKWRDDFCRHFYVELPLEEDFGGRSHKGLKGLKNLKKLHLFFSGREPLALPMPSEKRRWDDASCRFLQEKIGFEEKNGYPLSLECHKAIFKLKLDQYTWANLPAVDSLGIPNCYNKIPSDEL